MIVYGLDKNKNIYPVDTNMKDWWRELFKNENRIVKQTTVGDRFVSTIFLVIDHNFIKDDDPILFETMIFNSLKDGVEDFQERYRTYYEAIKAHDEIVEKLKQELL